LLHLAGSDLSARFPGRHQDDRAVRALQVLSHELLIILTFSYQEGFRHSSEIGLSA